jgi:hypothetical protein
MRHQPLENGAARLIGVKAKIKEIMQISTTL